MIGQQSFSLLFDGDKQFDSVMIVTSQKRLVAISHVTTPGNMRTSRSHGAVYSWIVTVLTEHLSTDLVRSLSNQFLMVIKCDQDKMTCFNLSM